MTIDQLQERLEELNTEAHTIRTKAESEKRDLTVDESNQLNTILDEFDNTKQNIDRLQKLDEQTALLRAGTGRRSEPDQPRGQPANLARDDDFDEPRPQRRQPAYNVRDDLRPKNGGFKSLGEFALSIKSASRPGGGYMDPRLERLAPTNVANEGTGAEGGFAVPTDYRTAIMTKVMGEDSLLPRTDTIPVAGNTLVVPKDNGTPWGTNGIRAYWGSEGALKNTSRPVLDTMTLRLHKVYALVPVTDELLEDAPALDAYLRRKAPEAIDFAINLAIIQGTGSGQPLGVLNSPALVTVAKESSQVADTIVANNIVKMWARLYAGNRSNAVWAINQSIEPMLSTLSMPGRDSTGAAVTGWGTHVYMPAGGLSGNPYGTLFGRPVIPTQATNELGDLGDIVLFDPKAYVTAVKSGANPKVEVSIHLWFDYDVTAFRFVLRMTGQPWWDSAVSPRDGSDTLSPYVTLAERA